MTRSTPPKNNPSAGNTEPSPTEQLPLPVAAAAPVPAPVTEPLAAPRSFIRRHPLGSGIAGAAIAVVLVSGLTAWGVGAAVTTSLASATASTAPVAPAPAAGSGRDGGRKASAGRVVLRATIDSIDGSTWKVTTRTGATATVTIDPATQFGTKRLPVTASSFAVGDKVTIVAMPSNTTAGSLAGTAARVVLSKAPTTGSTPQPTPMQSTAPTT